ncbi:MAG: ABC transporter permease [Thermomicrobiales bacterium]|nr:ABC transporter permease [Thermomicrobiales bacterium]
MRSFWAMVRANVKMSSRNRGALFWNLAFPALFIVVFGAIFGRGAITTFHVGIAEPASEFGEAAAREMEANPAFMVSRGPAEEELARLRGGERDIVLTFPVAEADGRPAATLYYDMARGPSEAMAVGVVRQTLNELAGGEPAAAIEEEPVDAQDITFMDAFLPGIVAMNLMNAGIIGLSTAFVNYREKGILRRIRVTPFPLTSFIFAQALSQLLVVAAQSIILVALAKLLFGFHLRGDPLAIALTVAVGGLTFLAIGFAISGVARNAEAAASYANLIAFPMLFLSGIFFSMDAAPGWLQPITRALPLPYLVDALRDLMTRGAGLTAVWTDLLVLLVVFAVAMTIAIRFFRWDASGAD